MHVWQIPEHIDAFEPPPPIIALYGVFVSVCRGAGAHDLTRLGGQRVMAESPELSDVTDGAKRRLDQQERKRTEQPAQG